MLLDRQNVSRHHIDRYFDENNIHPSNILEVNNMDLLIDFAKIDLGIACVIKDFVEDDLKQGNLIEIPLKHTVSKRKIGFVYEDSEHVTDSMKHFISYFTQE